MIIASLEDSSVRKRFVIFPKVYETLNFELKRNQLYLALAHLENNNQKEECFVIKKIAQI